LDADGKAALQRYFDLGGNFVAIHSASDCLRNTTFYGQEVGEFVRRFSPLLSTNRPDCLVGAFFDYHPVIQNAVS